MRFGQVVAPGPKRGSRYRVLAVCRISTDKQNEMSLDDQLALYHEWLRARLDGDYDIEAISSRGSGELLDRAELIELSGKIESGEYDLVIAEDLGRIARRTKVLLLCEAAEDSATRIVAINDHVDTLEDGWGQNASFATMRHESYNRDTACRIQRSLRNRFTTGVLVTQLPAGYIKPHPGASEADCSKDAAAEPVYDEWFRRLEDGQSFQEVANWLNSINFATGPAARKQQWDGTLVRQTTYNPLLKGLRERNRKVSKRVNSTGRRKCVKAPDDMLLTRNARHLAFIEPDRYDRVVRMLRRRNEAYRRGRAAGHDSRLGRPRSDTRWPGQHLRCGICGRKYVLGGHGRTNRMMCDGARSYDCWNAMTVDQPELAQAVADEIYRRIEALPEFDPELVRQVNAEADALAASLNVDLERHQAERTKIQREVDNLTDAVANGLSSSAVLSRLRVSEEHLQDIEDLISDAMSRQPRRVSIPSVAELRRLARESIQDLAVQSPEFARVMRKMVKEFYILPYRLIDGGMIMPRAVFQLDLGSLDGVDLPADLGCMRIDCQVDLTGSPQRVAHRVRVMQMRQAGHTEREIAEALGITQTAVQRAARLHRAMARQGVNDPWQPVRNEEEAAVSYKRVSNPRYAFNPLEGFTPKFPESVD